MVFFNPGGHALFLLALCILGPLLLLTIVGLIVSGGHLRQLAMVESARGGLAIDRYDERAQITAGEAKALKRAEEERAAESEVGF